MRHLYIFHNKDNMCFALCVTQLLNRDKNDFQIEKIAKQLQHGVGLTENTPVTFADVCKSEVHLRCKIVIVYKASDKAGFSFFQTSKIPHEKTLYLFLHDNHYYGVKSIRGFLGYSYVCHFCHSGFKDARNHRCEYSCSVCCDVDCYKHPRNITKCPDCMRLCRSKYCFDSHKALRQSDGGEYSQCKRGFYCGKCNMVYHEPFGLKSHVCPERLCKLCGEKLDTDYGHNCFIQPLKRERSNKRYIFYDFETRQETGTHTANFLCCINYRGQTWIFSGDTCVAAFFRHFRRAKFRGYTFIAHNARGFDSYLLLNHLVKEGINPKIIAQGGKILCFTDTDFNQKYIDSLSFLPMKLSNLPKAMGFSEKKKGYFPHFWNTDENQNYVGPYPDPRFYGVDNMMSKDREDFFKWYATVSDKVFDFKKEMTEYCVNDVDILRKGCIAFREEIRQSTSVDPFKCITIASVCMKIFKTMFLTENTLAVPPLDNYITRQKSFSTPAIQWLEYISATHSLPVQHALNKGEVGFGSYFVDDYFSRCFYHGCEKCFPSSAPHPLNHNVSFGGVRLKSMEKIKYLQDTHNLHVTTIWEHEWREMMENDARVINFLEEFDFPERLNPRDALYGGRTNALHLHYVAQPGERIDYYDFTSLYPYVNKSKTYPIGHPTIIFRDFEPLDTYFGIVRAKVSPPRGLWAPVLPSKNLFTDYIKMFLKTKQESSGYPSWVVDESTKREYIQNYERNEGIKLEEKNINVNPAKRSVAKLALNSLWGKMCQRPDRSNTTLIRDPAEFLNFIFSGVHNVSHFSFLSDEVALVQWRYVDDRMIKPGNANVFIGIFTTAYARLELYNLMDRLNRRCLYTDTDSVIFKSKEGDWMPPLSDYLGGLTKFESAGPKTYRYRTKKGKTTMKAKGITQNYTNSKVIDLKSLTDLVIDRVKYPDKPSQLITSHKQITRFISSDLFVRCYKLTGFHLRNQTQEKRYRVVYDKRVLFPDFTTLPYGY
ncbi:hypothetical protein Q7C36_015391 [Tachysurus vachellii]|uniref:DNA-directed DNA polymerase n=1 Tax=Tachysurus vachellii TaxID=175792 RepID=A0AA88SIN2_TACVA|nr:hypothetical protein Q7C36_015391 [Tachysurus vachellii]